MFVEEVSTADSTSDSFLRLSSPSLPPSLPPVSSFTILEEPDYQGSAYNINQWLSLVLTKSTASKKTNYVARDKTILNQFNYYDLRTFPTVGENCVVLSCVTLSCIINTLILSSESVVQADTCHHPTDTWWHATRQFLRLSPAEQSAGSGARSVTQCSPQ